ncbi:MAG: anaerobic ribonucleoside triphosphate reductase [Candidatus Izimaplasma bacterium HR2]|nr:MAG: anaerobic ribonucleoside triphosphate reductase [Candidatus Izimaplasma bacterium HR2]
MYLKVSYEQDFYDLFMWLKSKYPKKLFDIDGIGRQTDMSEFSKDFFSNKSTTSDVSIDANANVDDMSVIAYDKELPKPFFRLNSYYVLWKKMRQLYGKEKANNIIEKQLSGDIYINDFHGIGAGKNYCFNYSTYDIMLLGLPMVQKIKSVPPKYLYSFKSQLEQFITVASNSILGATGLADMLIVMSMYTQRILHTNNDVHFSFAAEDDIWSYVEATIESFIYTINQPMRGAESPFTNISIYDYSFLKSLCSEYTWIYEWEGEEYQIQPDIKVVQKLQVIFLDIMNKELNRTPVTFPITTACFSIDKNNDIQDEEFLNMIAEKNKDFGFINIYSGKTSTLSSCCFDGRQKILTKSSNGVKLSSFSELSNDAYDNSKKNLTVYHNGSWCSTKTIKIPIGNKKMFKVITANNKELLVTDDHIHLTDYGNKETVGLTTNDYLAFNVRKLDSFPEKCQKLTYEQGYLLGLYLGDGSKYKRKDSESYEITFSLNENNTPDLDIIKKALIDWGIEKELHVHFQNNTMLTKIYSKDLFYIINEYVFGNYAHEKELNMNILLQSIDFRKGVCDGWYASDGGNSNRIYTISEKLISQAEVLFNSIGINTIVNVSDRTGENKVIIRGETYNRNYPLYCVRWYDMKNKRSMGDIYKVINNTEYFKIISIEEYSTDDEYVYCFEMKNQDEPYFTLPNGVITHNCRLRSDKENEYFNSFGSGSSKIGSLGVSTINFPRLAWKSQNEEEFLSELEKLVIDCQDVNNAKRHIVQKRIDNGNHPLYTLGYMEITKQYSTVGVNGLYEAVEIMGYDILTKEGQDFTIRVLDTINDTNNTIQKKYDAPHNVEQIPAENVAVKLAEKDKLLKYNNGEYDLYSNQFIPLINRADILDRIELQGLFDSHFSGGAIAHLNIEQRIEDTTVIANLIRTAAKKGVVYFAINFILVECEEGHMSVGHNLIACPICGGEIVGEYQRVVGFLTPIRTWNKVRREVDAPNRVFYGKDSLGEKYLKIQ